MEAAVTEYAKNIREEADQVRLLSENQNLLKKLEDTQLNNATLLLAIDTCRRRVARLRQERNLLLDRVCEEGILPPEREILSGDSDCESEDFDSSFVDLKSTMVPSFELIPLRRPFSQDSIQNSTLNTTAVKPSTQRSSSGGSSRKRKPENSTPTDEGVQTPMKRLNFAVGQDGNPILPLSLGVVTLQDLGRVEWSREAFHNKRYVWPIGFHTTRTYASCIDADQPSALYHSRILDGGIAGPIFQVELDPSFIPSEFARTFLLPEPKPQPIIAVTNHAPVSILDSKHSNASTALDLLERSIDYSLEDKKLQTVFQSATPTGAWTAVSRQVALVRQKDHANSTSGPDFFGLSSATISTLIEGLSGVDRCINYQRRNSRQAPVKNASSREILAHAPSSVPEVTTDSIDEESGTEDFLLSDLVH